MAEHRRRIGEGKDIADIEEKRNAEDDQQAAMPTRYRQTVDSRGDRQIIHSIPLRRQLSFYSLYRLSARF
jgi:hypothetical protein